MRRACRGGHGGTIEWPIRWIQHEGETLPCVIASRDPTAIFAGNPAEALQRRPVIHCRRILIEMLLEQFAQQTARGVLIPDRRVHLRVTEQ
jgi:hypothetical protein